MRKEYQNWNEYQNANDMTRIKKPRRLTEMAGKKQDGTPTRQSRRHSTIEVDGKQVRVIDHLHAAARKLPRIYNKDDGKPFDHYQHMKALYMKHGIEGVNLYLKVCHSKYRQERSLYQITSRMKSRYLLVRWFGKAQNWLLNSK